MKKNEYKYQFTAMPVNLTACLDNNCRSMLFTLLQLSSYYADEDGWFFRSSADLQAQSRLSEILVRATISTLYRIGIVDVRLDGKSRNQSPNWFKMNEAEMLKWEKYSIEDCIKNPNYVIKTDPYGKGCKPSYLDKSHIKSALHTKNDSTESEDNLNANILQKNKDNIENAANEENTPNTNNNLSAGAHERVSTKSKDFHSPEMAEYKRREDEYMKHLSEVTYWCDFLIVAPQIEGLLKDAQTDKVRAYTIQRYQGVKKGRIAFFTKKFQADPYQPEAKTFFAWLEKNPQWQQS